MKSFRPVALLIGFIVLTAIAAGDSPAHVPAMAVFATAGLSSKELLENRGAFMQEARKLMNQAGREERDLTDEECTRFDELMANVDACEKALDEKENQLRTHGVDLNKVRGSAVRPDDQRSRQPGRVLFRDEKTGQDVRAYAHNEPMGEYEASDVGKMLYAQLTGRMDLLEPHEITNLGAGSGDGYLLTPSYSQSIIDLARSNSVAMQAGAQTVTMEGSELRLIRLLEDPVAQWRHPGNPVTATGMEFGMLVLTPRTLACVIPIHMEWLEDSRNGQRVIENALRAALGLKLDQAVLMGSGAAEPRGIINEPTINEISSVGTPTNFSEIRQAVGDILTANYPGEVSNLALIRHPRDGETYDGLLDADNNPLRPSPWAADLRPFYTTSLPTTDGAGSDESTMILGDFKQVIVGMRRRITIRVLESGSVTDSDGVTHNAASELKKLIVAHMRADVGVLRPTWLAKLTGVTAS